MSGEISSCAQNTCTRDSFQVENSSAEVKTRKQRSSKGCTCSRCRRMFMSATVQILKLDLLHEIASAVLAECACLQDGTELTEPSISARVLTKSAPSHYFDVPQFFTRYLATESIQFTMQYANPSRCGFQADLWRTSLVD